MAALFVSGCVDQSSESDDPEDNVFVDDGKAGDYFSTSAAEFLVEGRTLSPRCAARTSAHRRRDAEGRYLIALELVAGKSLTGIITMPLPPDRVMLIAGQVLHGLEHAHA